MASLSNILSQIQNPNEDDVQKRKQTAQKSQDFQNTYGGGGADETEPGLEDSLPFLGSTREDPTAPLAGTLMIPGAGLAGATGEAGEAAGATSGGSRLAKLNMPPRNPEGWSAGAATGPDAPYWQKWATKPMKKTGASNGYKSSPGITIKD